MAPRVFPLTPIMRSSRWKSRALDEQLGTSSVPKEAKIVKMIGLTGDDGLYLHLLQFIRSGLAHLLQESE